MPKDSIPQDPLERYRRLAGSEAETQAEAAANEVGSEPQTRHSRRSTNYVNQKKTALPRRVEEIDIAGTQVTPAAFDYASTSKRSPSRRRRWLSRINLFSNWRNSKSCLLRIIIVAVFVLVALALILAAIGIFEYYTIATSLPPVEDLKMRASQFETTRIFDRNGNLLYEILDPNAGRRTYVALDQISPFMVAATIATEDKGFYSHPGFDPIAILRAFWQNMTSGETVSGASTITQQLARALLFTPEERGQRTYLRKIREAILAAEIDRRYSKDEILELYLNEIYYGNLAYGVEAAAMTYFNKHVSELSLGEAAFLAGLPQAPSIYDIFTNPTETIKRMQQVIVLMYQANDEQKCIYVSNSSQPICIDPSSAALAVNEIQDYPFQPPIVNMRFPHWVQYVRTQLETMYDPQTIYRSGFNVYTTLDPGLQDFAQKAVSTQVSTLAERHVTDGALVAIRPTTGEIIAMVGSADFYNESISGQVNMAVSQTRQPGSSIKPFTYLAAFEKGWTPATLLWDVPSEFPPSGKPSDPRPPYIPTNYDEEFHGPVTIRTALANSYNIPAVKALQFVGVYDDPETPLLDGLIGMAERMGISSFTRDDYGLALTLGGGEVSLLDMTSGYGVIANAGVRVAPVSILKIVDYQGNIVYEYQPQVGKQVISPEHAFLMSSILSDNAARATEFGSKLNLPFQAAVKTGTSNYFTDNWTLGYTPDLAVGVWVGNADYTPMIKTSGLTGAAPIWSQFMMTAIQQLTGGNPTPFVKPVGVVEHTICTISGSQPSQWCPSQQMEYFTADQPPLLASEDLWKQIFTDTWTGLEASPDSSDFTDQHLALNVTDDWAREWILQEPLGQQTARNLGFERVFFVPERKCTTSDPRPYLQFIGFEDGQTITQSNLDISIIADASANFQYWRFDYSSGNEPASWISLIENTSTAIASPTKIYTWDLTGITSNTVVLRLYMQSTSDGYAQRLIRLNLILPTPTSTPFPTPTITQTSSQTLTLAPTNTATPTLTVTQP